ncbi:MAG: DUF11 domain-containing protein, partial [Armatimonadetes bacterium]|nr:DUF11 domain-containing protein [Armatimonadota bacterium]
MATYEDPASGAIVELDSNPVTVVVQPLEALVLVQDQTREAAIGTVVHLPHRLTNTGNVASVYALWHENLRDDDGELGGLRLVRDTNGNGRADDGEETIGPGNRPVLAPDESLDLVLVANFTQPVSQGARLRAALHVVTTEQGLAASNIDTIIARGTSGLELLKSIEPAAPAPGELATYHLTVRPTRPLPPQPTSVNVDSLPQELIWAVDEIPLNTVFESLTAPGAGTPLYHLRGTPADRFVSTPPAAPAQVDAVGYGLPQLLAGDGFGFSFAVRLLPHAAGEIVNIAAVHYRDPLTGQEEASPSNSVVVPLACLPPDIDFFVDGTFSVRTGVGQAGSPLFCQVVKGAANLLPDEIDTLQVQLTSTLTGDVEVYTAVETGPNTGVFQIQPEVPTSLASRAPRDGVLETGVDDTITTAVASCEGGTAEARLVINPTNVVFDSVSNLPLAGARIVLIDLTGASNGGRPGEPAVVLAADGSSPAPNEQTTGADGSFSFPWLPPGTYRIEVVPPAGYTFASQYPPAQQPAERVLDSAGSYGQQFSIQAGGNAVRFDVPLDAPPPTGLFVEKTASRNVAEIGDYLDYRITIRNTNITAATAVVVSDRLPQGFAYQTGSARLDGEAVAEVTSSAAGLVTFNLPNLAAQAEAVLTYRVRLTAGAVAGEQVNRASAAADSVYGGLTSNTATATVEVHAGVFSDRAVLLGQVYVDLNGNRRLDRDEPGLPGVRIWLEDGTYAVTDGEGRYSLYGLRPGTRVAKVDPLTLPVGAVLEPLTHRHGDRGESRFVDLKNGELHKANFALAPPSPAVLAEIEA